MTGTIDWLVKKSRSETEREHLNKILQDILTSVGVAGGTAAWGSITGTLSSQTDLVAALATKLDASSYTATDVLTKLLTVDGSGSGLDADKLDGNDSSYYQPMTTKGDMIAFGTSPARLPVGSDGQVIVADSTQTLGVKWGSAGTASPLTTKGDLYTYDTANTRLAVGTDGQTLLADSTQSTGLRWGTPTVSGAVGGLGLVAEYVVSGSAVTNIDISGLDLSTDGTYYIECAFKNATASTSSLSLYFNGDNTATNYYREVLTANSTGLTSSRSNDGFFAVLDASSHTTVHGFLRLDAETRPRGKFDTVRGDPSGIILQNFVHTRTTTGNVTSLRVSASVASSIDVGSFIRIYRLVSTEAATRRVLKTTNETRTATTTLADDSQLTVYLAAGKHRLRTRMYYSSSGTACDLKHGVAFSGTLSSCIGTGTSYVAGTASGASAASDSTTNAFPSTGTHSITVANAIGYVDRELILDVSVAGTFSVQWAQNTSNAEVLTVYAGSYIDVVKFA